MSVAKTRLDVAEAGLGDDQYASRPPTLGENIVLTLKVLAGMALLGAALWAANLWTAAK